MPLSFSTLNHGGVAFGFFNIETDLLLLNHNFFFADVFCKAVNQLAEREPDDFSEMTWPAYRLAETDIGDLHGAIRGTRLVGFIGDVYRQFPFPRDPRAFKQNPEGYQTRDLITGLIQKYAQPSTINVLPERDSETIQIGEFLFSRVGFCELLDYVWVGGYPRWKLEKRPPYLTQMKTKVENSRHPLFKGLALL
jgi:hypothetical protein